MSGNGRSKPGDEYPKDPKDLDPDDKGPRDLKPDDKVPTRQPKPDDRDPGHVKPEDKVPVRWRKPGDEEPRSRPSPAVNRPAAELSPVSRADDVRQPVSVSHEQLRRLVYPYGETGTSPAAQPETPHDRARRASFLRGPVHRLVSLEEMMPAGSSPASVSFSLASSDRHGPPGPWRLYGLTYKEWIDCHTAGGLLPASQGLLPLGSSSGSGPSLLPGGVPGSAKSLKPPSALSPQGPSARGRDFVPLDAGSNAPHVVDPDGTKRVILPEKPQRSRQASRPQRAKPPRVPQGKVVRAKQYGKYEVRARQYRSRY